MENKERKRNRILILFFLLITMAAICPMISCSTLRELAAACRKLAQA